MRIKSEVERVRKEVRNKTMTYIAGGFGLVAGLAWNDAIKSLIEFIFPRSGDTVTIKFIYAAIITVLVVVVIMSLNKFLKEEDPVVE